MDMDGLSSPPLEVYLEEHSTNLEEDFISHFERLPELWNAQHGDYKNKLRRQIALNKLLTTLQRHRPYATVDDVRKKINTLRSNYRRELRKVAESHKNGDVSVSTSRNFNLLGFLYDTEAQDSVLEDQYSPEMHIKNEEFKTDEPQPSVSSANEVPYKKFRSIAPKTPIQSEVQKTQTSPPIFQESTNALAYVWTQKLEKMDPKQRLFAEKAINDVLFEAELGNLHRHSVKINECM